MADDAIASVARMTSERVLRAILMVGEASYGPVVARVVDDQSFAGWLLLVEDAEPMPQGWVDGWLQPEKAGPDIAVRLQSIAGGRVYFTERVESAES